VGVEVEPETREAADHVAHGGGDAGLIDALYDEMTKPASEPLEAGIDSTAHSHILAFAAEEARITRSTVDLASFMKEKARLTT
jgi:hypothetical protein